MNLKITHSGNPPHNWLQPFWLKHNVIMLSVCKIATAVSGSAVVMIFFLKLMLMLTLSKCSSAILYWHPYIYSQEIQSVPQ